jgi:AcrR family transcriptional regulator
MLVLANSEEGRMAADTRARMIGAAVAALQHRGVAGMSFTEILTATGAARGAIYHHFPGGKSELVAEAATRSGEDVRAVLDTLPGDTPTAVLENFVDLVRPVVAASAAGGGCAVAAVTVDPESEELRHIAAAAFDSWTGALAARLDAAGLPVVAADELATTLITLLEGAHVLCRAAGRVDPFERMARTALTLVASCYPQQEEDER